ncbi:MAG: hypothetical protein PHP35_01125, partial [Candidatus Colwellbacteria bacterium]|nr:hypothetical protein [Candidatus Colwellbacteria bacterium]
MIEIYFKDKYLEFDAISQLFIRIISAVALILTVVATVVFLFSESVPLQYAGMLLLIFTIDRLVNRNKPMKSLKRLPDSGRINAADYFLPKTKEIIYSAAQSSNTDKTDIGLEII